MNFVKKVCNKIKVLLCIFCPIFKKSKITIYNIAFKEDLGYENKTIINKKESFVEYRYRLISEIRSYHRLNNAKAILKNNRNYYSLKIYKVEEAIECLKNNSSTPISTIIISVLSSSVPFIIMYCQTIFNFFQQFTSSSVENLKCTQVEKTQIFNEVMKIVNESIGSITIKIVIGLIIYIYLVFYCTYILKEKNNIKLKYYKTSLQILNELISYNNVQ